MHSCMGHSMLIDYKKVTQTAIMGLLVQVSILTHLSSFIIPLLITTVQN